MERRKRVFSFLVGLGVTVFLAVGLDQIFEEALGWGVVLAVAVMVGFFVRESIQQDMALLPRSLFSLGVGLIIYLVYLVIQLGGGV